VYTGTSFTVPNVPLTAITNTVLLTCQSNRFVDNSTTNATMTLVGTPTVLAQSPFSPSAAWSPTTNGGSFYLNGTADYFTVAANTSLVFTADFTVETWAYATATTNATDQVFNYGNFTFMLYHAGTTWTVEVGSGSANYFTLTGTAVLNAWHHFAITRLANVYNFWIDGVSASTATNANAPATTSATLSIGRAQTGANQWFTGYLSNFRMTKGTALYTATFTPPTAPFTTTAGTTLLLNCTDGGIIDAHSTNDAMTVLDARVNTSVKKYNNASLYFDASASSWLPTTPAFGYGTGDWTIEFWLYLNAVTTQNVVSNLSATAGTQPHIYYSSGVGLLYHTASATRITGTALSTATWYHIAVCKASGSTKMFYNGTQTGSTYTDANNYGTSNPLSMGDYFTTYPTLGGTLRLNGYIDDLRITKGFARYTANFTAPTAAFLTL
jgi:hypothetical protein